MTIEEVTLVAAVVAALASVLRLVLDRLAEGRASNRALVQPLILEMGEAIDGIVAASTALATTETPRTFRSYYTKAFHEREKLKVLRPRLRYVLWGFDEGLLVLERLPVWCARARSDRDRSARLLIHASALRQVIDVAAVRCYRSGRQPSALERARVRFHARKCRWVFEHGAAKAPR
jgi:hypothetical protein